MLPVVSFSAKWGQVKTDLSPSKHTTMFWRPSDVHNLQKTLNRRQNNILCQQGKTIYTAYIIT